MVLWCSYSDTTLQMLQFKITSGICEFMPGQNSISLALQVLFLCLGVNCGCILAFLQTCNNFVTFKENAL